MIGILGPKIREGCNARFVMNATVNAHVTICLLYNSYLDFIFNLHIIVCF